MVCQELLIPTLWCKKLIGPKAASKCIRFPPAVDVLILLSIENHTAGLGRKLRSSTFPFSLFCTLVFKRDVENDFLQGGERKAHIRLNGSGV